MSSKPAGGGLEYSDYEELEYDEVRGVRVHVRKHVRELVPERLIVHHRRRENPIQETSWSAETRDASEEANLLTIHAVVLAEVLRVAQVVYAEL